MIYLDNAATSRFKPKSVTNALLYDIAHSANAGRSGHKQAIEKSLVAQRCRDYLLTALGGKNTHEIIFEKSCTEALNQAIFGFIKGGEHVVTSSNEHNSVLRPLHKLKQDGKITLEIIDAESDGSLDLKKIKEAARRAQVFVFGGACNVTGAIANIEEIGKIAKEHNVTLIVDGAQSIPVIDTNLQECNIDMLACPAHKGLHGLQGVGFLAVKKDITLSPLLFGGTGTESELMSPEIKIPDSFEVGTQFSGGISALYEGAKWSLENISKTRNHLDRLSKNLIYYLKNIGAEVYTSSAVCGVVAFNIGKTDSTYIADKLDEYDVCVRAGLHCAPLVHSRLNTLTQGAIRASLGCDTTSAEIVRFASITESIARNLRLS